MSEKRIHSPESEDILMALDQVEQTIEVMCDTLIKLKEKVTIHLNDADNRYHMLAQELLEESVAPKQTRH